MSYYVTVLFDLPSESESRFSISMYLNPDSLIEYPQCLQSRHEPVHTSADSGKDDAFVGQ